MGSFSEQPNPNVIKDETIASSREQKYKIGNKYINKRNCTKQSKHFFPFFSIFFFGLLERRKGNIIGTSILVRLTVARRLQLRTYLYNCDVA